MLQFIQLLIFFNIILIGWCNVGDISRKKCIEYSKLVYQQEMSPVLLMESKYDNVSKCTIIETPLIVGGVNAAEMEFPHMAVIGFGRSNTEWSCGGSLISENFILTAGHCLTDFSKGDAYIVRLGIIHLQNVGNYLQEIEVDKIISHPEYSPENKYNDIGLLRLKKSVKFNAYVRPACLNTDENYSWTKAIATGFGRLTFESSGGSVDLMKVQLSNIDTNTCKSVYKMNRAMSEGVIRSQFCAGEMKGEKDTCQGDSGGPLQTVLKNPYCMYNLIGVTSFGKFCGFSDSPGMYTRVASYIQWIENIVW